MDAKRKKLEKDLQMWRAKKDPIGEGQTLTNLAYLDVLSGDMSHAREKYEEAAMLLEAAGDKDSLSALLHERANFEWQMGNEEKARAMYRRSIDLAREIGNKQVEAAVLHGLAMMEYQAGHMDAARKGFEESLKLKLELDDKPNTAATQMMLGPIIFNDAVRTHSDRHPALDMLKRAIQTYEDRIMPGEALAGLRILTNLQRMDDVLKAGEEPRAEDQSSRPVVYDKLH